MSDARANTGTGLIARWNRFWYAEGNSLSLGIFRALFAISLVWEIPVTRAKSTFGLEGGFHFLYVPFIRPLPPELYNAFHDWQYPFTFLLLLGIFPRIASAVLLFLQAYIFFTDQLNFRNHPYFFLLLLLFFVFSPAGESFSIPSLVRRMRKRGEDVSARIGRLAPLTAQRLMQFQVSIVYFYAAVHKMSAEYFSGHVLADQMSRAVFSARSGRFLTENFLPATLDRLRTMVSDPGFWVIPAWVTVILEVSLPFALWVPRLRVAAMLFGIPFHIAIAFVMSIDIFSSVMISSYLLFLDPDTVPRLWVRVRDRFSGARPSVKQPRARKPKAMAKGARS